MKNVLKNPILKSTLLVFLSFLLTSTGHLAWMYHLMTFVSAQTSDLITMVAGYALQAAGVGIFALFLRFGRLSPRSLFAASNVLYAVCLVPSVLGTSAEGSAVFGLLMSFFCGMIAGAYLYELTVSPSSNRVAASFGIGYSSATVVAWLLSLLSDGSGFVLAVCFVLAALNILCTFLPSGTAECPPKTVKPSPAKLLILMGGVVLLFSLVNNIGFSFSTLEIQNGLRLEFSRLFYAVGLIAAGFLADRSRKYGAICALAALVIPFIVFALRGEPISSSIFWAIGYLAFGFYSVFRVVLFSDISRESGRIYLSGLGLLIGRLGDAVGSGICTALSGMESVRVVIAALLFIGSVFLFFGIYRILYVPNAARQKSEREIFNEFSSKHDLSPREREVLKLVLSDKTNKEIAEELFVSESTVKFHVHNLLQKTGCKTRLELITDYSSAQD